MDIEKLLSWYGRHARLLPWRTSGDPYGVWVSELMLQQTRVDTVLAYYSRWMQRFPTIESLAESPADDVLKMWQGLGYYRRARFLHQGANMLMLRHQGRFPETLEQALALPGIGSSTASSILSICFGHRLPVFDGNVQRVAARLEAFSQSLTRPAAQRHLHGVVAQWVAACDRPGDFNQAMMDLGATVCLPTQPRCGECPLDSTCKALAAGIQRDLPVKDKKPPVPHYHVSVAMLEHDGHLFLQQRPDEGLLARMWELPGGKLEPGESPPEALVRELQEELGLVVTPGLEVATIKHAYSHFKVTLHVFRCDVDTAVSQVLSGPGRIWSLPCDLHTLVLPKATEKVLEKLKLLGPQS